MVSAVQWPSMTSLILTAPSMASVILLDCIVLTLALSDRYDFDDGGRNVRPEAPTLTFFLFRRVHDHYVGRLVRERYIGRR